MERKNLKEYYSYIIIYAFMSALYLYVRFFALDENLFGFDQLKNLKFRVVFISYAFICLIIVLTPIIIRRFQFSLGIESMDRIQFFVLALTVALICATLFFLFRNEFINSDGQKYSFKFLRDIPEMGAHMTHDEMWELYLHSRFWYYMDHFFGWSVPFSYQIMSSFAGGVFIFILSYFSKNYISSGIYFFIGMLSGGYMQLFFGDVENYTLVTVLLLVYIILSIRFIARKNSIIAPSVVLAIAISFHLLAGWLLPSLLLLYWWAFKRRDTQKIMWSLLLSGLVIGITLLFFHYNGLPIDKLFFESHALGHGGTKRMLVMPSWEHYSQIVNLLFLLFPSLLFFIPMISHKRILLTDENIFLIISSLCMLVLMFIWNPILGVYEDWNLFAPGMISLATLFWRNFSVIEDMKHKPQIFIGIFLISSLHSYSWIISNHFYNS